MTELTAAEFGQLTSLEQVIERGLSAFVEVGRALQAIRDGKLYRRSHKTFEAYCRDRWEIGRSRAYELIDQAEVTDALLGAADLSAVADISKRDVRALKTDLPAATAEIKARVEKGEEPVKAVQAVVAARQEQKGQAHAGAEEVRNAHVSELHPDIQARIAAQEQRKAKGEQPSPDVEELLAQLGDRDNDITELTGQLNEANAKLAKFDDMVAEYERGGFEAVIEGLKRQIRVAESRFYSTNEDMVSWKKKAKFEEREKLRYKAAAERLGYSDDIDIDDIDPETGEVLNG